MEEFSRDIVVWINTFEGLSSSCSNAPSLCDGILLTEVMAQIAPGQFEYELTAGSSWAGHKMNLSYLVRGLEDYYRDFHSKEFELDFLVDLDLLSQDRDMAALAVLMEFIVGAAVQCQGKCTRPFFQDSQLSSVCVA